MYVYCNTQIYLFDFFFIQIDENKIGVAKSIQQLALKCSGHRNVSIGDLPKPRTNSH